MANVSISGLTVRPKATRNTKRYSSVEGVLERVSKKAGKEASKNSSHLRNLVGRLADSDALNTAPGNEGDGPSIDFSDVFHEPQTVYMHLSSGAGTGTSAETARMALYSLIHSAYSVEPENRVQTFVIIDEFQRIVASNLEMVLQLASSLNIGVILANQTLADLKQAGIDLVPAVSANTRFRQVFAVSYLGDQEDLSRASGETVTHHRSFMSTVASTFGVSDFNFSERIGARQRINDLLLTTDKLGRSLVQIRRGAGFAQYGGFSFAMQSGYTVDREEYRKRRATPWPEVNEETILEAHRERSYDREIELPPVGKPRSDLFMNESTPEDKTTKSTPIEHRGTADE